MKFIDKVFKNPQKAKAIRALLRHKPGLIGMFMVLSFVFLAIFADVLAPADPFLKNTDISYLPPFWKEGSQMPYYLGTDMLGRDLFSRLLYGSRLSLMIGFISVGVGLLNEAI